MAFMETSAKDSTNVKMAFEKTFFEIYKLLTKNTVKDSKRKVTKIGKGKSLNITEDGIDSIQRNDCVKLERKKLNPEQKNGCC